MQKKKLIRYVIILAVILTATFLLPLAIRAGSDLIVKRILRIQEKNDETEENSENAKERQSPFRLDGFDQTEGESFSTAVEDSTGMNAAENGGDQGGGGSTDGKEQERKENLDEKLQAYRDLFHPKVEGTKSGLYEIFIGDREAAFILAVADYMFSVYGGGIMIDEIDIADFISNDETEIACQILVRAGDSLSYYYASYNKKHDFYSIYAYQE